MNENRKQLEALLDRVAAGELDALAPSEIEQLEAHLNEAPEAAMRLADVRPPTMRIPAPAIPAESAWDSVFERVVAADDGVETTSPVRPASVAARRGRLPRLLKAWEPLLAAAAVVLLAVVWRFSPVQPNPADNWDLHLATDVSVDEIETYGDATSFVAYSDDGSTVIWVVENDSDNTEGA